MFIIIMIIINVRPVWCASGAELREDVSRRRDIGDTERRPDVQSAAHAQRRRRRCALRRRPRPPGISAVIATAPVSAARHLFPVSSKVLKLHRKKIPDWRTRQRKMGTDSLWNEFSITRLGLLHRIDFSSFFTFFVMHFIV